MLFIVYIVIATKIADGRYMFEKQKLTYIYLQILQSNQVKHAPQAYISEINLLIVSRMQ